MGLETALVAAIGVSAAGTTMGTMSARQAGKDEKAVLDANAAVMQQNATAQIEKGRDEASLIKERAKKLLARSIVNAGAGGGDLSGSNLAVIGDSAFEAERDVQMTLRNSQLNARSMRNQAAIYTAQGKSAKKAGNIRALTTLIQGGSNMLGLYAAYSGLGGGAGNTPGTANLLSKSPDVNNWLMSPN